MRSKFQFDPSLDLFLSSLVLKVRIIKLYYGIFSFSHRCYKFLVHICGGLARAAGYYMSLVGYGVLKVHRFWQSHKNSNFMSTLCGKMFYSLYNFETFTMQLFTDEQRKKISRSNTWSLWAYLTSILDKISFRCKSELYWKKRWQVLHEVKIIYQVL